ncbi:MAG TPA: hypothetical protein VFK94_02110 [Patescibacteria group bacterium]|nr:hypothetical protein [Patescibacteria group bacterium]
MPGKLILPGDPGFLTPEKVNELHAFDDVDVSPTAHHHTLGGSASQAAPGNHTHAQYLWLRTTASVSVPANAWTAITWNDVEKNTAPSYWIVGGVNPWDILIKKKGLYLISSLMTLNATPGMAYHRLCVDETAYGGRVTSFTNNLDGHEFSLSQVLYINVDSYINAQVYSSGTATSTKWTQTATEWIGPRLMLTYLGS